MLKSLFENKGASDKSDTSTRTGGNLTREDLERSKELLLSSLAFETDPAKLNEGVSRIADFNASIQRLDSLSAARSQINQYRRECAAKQAQMANAGREAFLQNCQMITAVSIDSQTADDNLLAGIQKRQQKYFSELVATLSFEDAERQVDEICNADRERRDWKPVVTLPNIPEKSVARVNQHGESV